MDPADPQLSDTPTLGQYIKDGKLLLPYSFPFRRQPLKGLYLFYRFIRFLATLPIWTFQYAVRDWRPRRSWTLRQALSNRQLSWMFQTYESVGLAGRERRDYSQVTLSRVRDHPDFVLIPAAPSHLVIGDIKAYAEKAKVKPEVIVGYWYGSTPEGEPVTPEEVVVMNMHGGAYITCSAHPSDITAAIPKGLLVYGKRSGNIDRVLSIDYRVSSAQPFTPTGQFPSAVLDALSGYVYLLSLGFKPQNIIFSGDSAGGNLALAIMRYIIETNHPDIPVPKGGLLLTSPWADMSLQHYRPGGTSETNCKSDYLGSIPNTVHYALVGHIGVHDPHEYLHNPYFSPASPFLPQDVKPFDQRWPRTMVIAGGGEVMLDQIKSLKRIMLEGGVELTWCEMEDAVHDFFLVDCFEEHGRKGFEAIVAWLEAGKVHKTV